MNSAKKGYQPPFSITVKIIQLVAEISENIGRLSTEQEQAKALRLRRINRIRTIHGSLAIEGNLLDASQITAIIGRKRAIAPISEIQKARNTIVLILPHPIQTGYLNEKLEFTLNLTQVKTDE
ncbi:hypothetical protein [Photorhabdus khanii]|uniref:hypothetical protein n=1 Tax=Photorhabdus khanii TaxID=1004150 RepID=UPI001864D5C7|nr:hypothetical protein [Photorhabdus khanii]